MLDRLTKPTQSGGKEYVMNKKRTICHCQHSWQSVGTDLQVCPYM